MEAFASAYPVQDHPVCIVLGHVAARGDSLVIRRVISICDGRSVQVLHEMF